MKYLGYVLRHKYFVMIECFKMGLMWEGMVHDISKFFPSEWMPYVKKFYGKKPTKNCWNCNHIAGSQCAFNGSGIGDGHGAEECQDYEVLLGDFDAAWNKHIHRNPHHWEYWMLYSKAGGFKLIDMPERQIKEMVCDWVGAGKAQGNKSPVSDPYSECRIWYDKNRGRIQLSEKSRKLVQELIK